jgi:NAD(P)-dependent dehydrogenase (short-subunit alcohol dehydrogenase family)
MDLTDSVCIVTGGGSGIGAALCRAMADAGAAGVVVVDRNAAGAEAIAAGLGERAMAVACDVGDEADVNRMVDAVMDRFGRIDVLCNNAGIANDGDIMATPLEVWDQQWQVNVMAHVYAIRAVLPHMLERGSGIIQHTASMAGILTSHGACTYATTKHAVVGLAEWLSISYHDRGIRVHLLAPLGVNTPMLDTSSDFARNAAGPIREPDEVAGQVLDAFADERFLVLTDPVAQTWMERKTADIERWLVGMRRLQARLFPGGG